ncbi:beta-mannosidase [Paenibacillus sp. HWE-109]|uniref:glycoside hydrolase family 2 protein n=1 Tax=Paenibacillus sp. HWE-109 TaxID=1306526 RepID=UPI001EDE5CDF|nr:sugar-binding domain-containing protein [Paenibacillus sp. HWE-109]UKS26681.1 beta-mannosidase [Paenibacillus sp. HWE-109]
MKLQLNEGWQLTGEPLFRQADDYRMVRNKQQDWLQVDLPCDVHMPLIEHGIIAEPLVADQCFASEWTEKRSWWFKKEFDLTEEQLTSERMVLHFESLDVEADVWLNDCHLGHHRSAFYPFACDLKGKAQQGANQLLVRVTSGLERYSENDLAFIHEAKIVYENEQIGHRGDHRRGMLRKPQYVFGWDWGPRVATCGIMGEVHITCVNRMQIRDIQVTTTSLDTAGNAAHVQFQLELENLHPYQTLETQLKLELLFGTEQVQLIEEDCCLRSGLNYVTLQMKVPDAKLWWPNGMGEQPLYTVRATLQTTTHAVDYPAFLFGIRTLRLKMDKIPQSPDERSFTFEINGVTTFSKGGNWIPADSIYARVTDAKYDALLREAKEANFNMLRVWGGGIYERDIFYDKCDEYGILIWHDFMFSCAKYPDNLSWFRHEVEQEIDYQTRRLRNHCSLALWCGNNENHWGFEEWWNETDAADFYGGAACYNDIAPRLVQQNCPTIPYWNSSPYGGEHPNGSQSGDTHHWNDTMMHADIEKRIVPEEYDKVSAKFVSEYGYIGPSRKSSVEIYHQGQPLDRDGKLWRLHTNMFEKDTVLAGINRHYVNPAHLAIEDYLLYAGLCQGLMLAYSLEAMRAKLFCSGALFWMYNDCWGEVGWSIIDYYLTRKIAYYFVKRALAPVKLILRQQDGVIQLTAINETSAVIRETMVYGLVRYDGSGKQTQEVDIDLPPFSREVVLQWTASPYKSEEACLFAGPLSESSELKPAVLHKEVVRNLRLPDPQLQVSNVQTIDAGLTRFTVSSDTFAHAVHFGLDDAIQLSDEYFDLLPAEKRDITIRHEGFALPADSIVPRSILLKS